MKTWLEYPVVSAPMSFQMAFDELIFRRALEPRAAEVFLPVARFYFSSEPWETVGYSQRVDPCPAGLPVCRRLTGGGRVRHGDDLIFSFVAPHSAYSALRHVAASYVAVHEVLQEAIGRVTRKNVRFFRCSENLPKGPDCFRYPIATDLAVGNRKVAGGAQKRSCGVVLHQESIHCAPADAWALMAEIRKTFEARWDIRWQPALLDASIIAEAEALSGFGREKRENPLQDSEQFAAMPMPERSGRLAGVRS
jgi:lipoate-protein ligase A